MRETLDRANPMNAKKKKTKILNLRIDPELKKAAKRLAEADDRSLSNWVTRLIQREVEKAEKRKS